MSFDRLAPHYDWMEAVSAGSLLQRVRTTWIDALAGRRRVLSAGEGHGRFAQAFTRRFPGSELTCVDASVPMLARAQRRLARTDARVRWIQAALPAWQPSSRAFDAIVTCFFLDCFPPHTLRATIASLASAAADDAVWLVVDFAIPERGPARWRAQAIHAAMYGFFRAATRLPAHRLTPPDEDLRAHGFELQGRREYSWGLLRADLWRRQGRPRR